MNDFIDKNIVLASNSYAPLVAIMLCTYNGAKFLAEQLDSLETQTHQNWLIIASDDGSTDQTLEILQQYQAKWPSGKLAIRSGPQKGFCQNFFPSHVILKLRQITTPFAIRMMFGCPS
jgi:glycosyltransferase involved in cell wall biosynthesis